MDTSVEQDDKFFRSSKARCGGSGRQSGNVHSYAAQTPAIHLIISLLPSPTSSLLPDRDWTVLYASAAARSRS